jgi:hypothetical protein
LVKLYVSLPQQSFSEICSWGRDFDAVGVALPGLFSCSPHIYRSRRPGKSSTRPLYLRARDCIVPCILNVSGKPLSDLVVFPAKCKLIRRTIGISRRLGLVWRSRPSLPRAYCVPYGRRQRLYKPVSVLNAKIVRALQGFARNSCGAEESSNRPVCSSYLDPTWRHIQQLGNCGTSRASRHQV